MTEIGSPGSLCGWKSRVSKLVPPKVAVDVWHTIARGSDCAGPLTGRLSRLFVAAPLAPGAPTASAPSYDHAIDRQEATFQCHVLDNFEGSDVWWFDFRSAKLQRARDAQAQHWASRSPASAWSKSTQRGHSRGEHHIHVSQKNRSTILL